MSTPEVTQPVTFPAPLSWLQGRMPFRVRPYQLAVAGLIGLVTAFFAVVFILMILVGLNFNLLGWTE